MGLGGINIWSLIIILIIILPSLWLGALVLKKAGYSGWWSLTMFIPLVNIIMMWVFAFGTWPIEQKKT
jgi:uncharacterized membrane protein YhaH (DUF805 family)